MTAREDMIAAVCGTLERVAEFLDRLPEDAYRAPMPDCLDATIGQHVRHCLDHFETLAQGLADGDLDYDARGREAGIEADVNKACAWARRLESDLRERLADADPARSVRVRSASARSGIVPWQASSVGRELQFVVSHTVHHLAMVASCCRRRGLTVPDDFGIAPSTLRHRDALAARRAD